MGSEIRNKKALSAEEWCQMYFLAESSIFDLSDREIDELKELVERFEMYGEEEEDEGD